MKELALDRRRSPAMLVSTIAGVLAGAWSIAHTELARTMFGPFLWLMLGAITVFAINAWLRSHGTLRLFLEPSGALHCAESMSDAGDSAGHGGNRKGWPVTGYRCWPFLVVIESAAPLRLLSRRRLVVAIDSLSGEDFRRLSGMLRMNGGHVARGDPE